MKPMTLIFTILFVGQLWAKEDSFKIYAAASLSNVLQEISKQYKTSIKIVFNFDASSKLAKQIESGAPADVYFSADADWMEYLDNKGKIVSESKINLLSNQMAVIAPADSVKTPLNLKDLKDDFYHHIALAAESVPAGKFARAALKSEGIFSDSFQKKIVNADNVRIALSWVAKYESPAGIVYLTDANAENNVKVAFIIPKELHPQIIYPAAIVKSSPLKEEAQRFIQFCRSKQAQEIFQKAGFKTL